jgi:hypothetical protein
VGAPEHPALLLPELDRFAVGQRQINAQRTRRSADVSRYQRGPPRVAGPILRRVARIRRARLAKFGRQHTRRATLRL